MKGASKLIMGTTLAISIALAIVISLILLLLADLYFSLLLLRLRRRQSPPTTTAAAATSPKPLPAPGVLLHPPRSFLYPTENNNNNNNNNTPIEYSPEHLVYICNPIYNETAHTPYETPESSPSRLGCSDDVLEGEDIDEYVCVCMYSPQLKPMKKLQPEACSVSLRDGSSLATSASGSDTNSTGSGSPNTSPSW